MKTLLLIVSIVAVLFISTPESLALAQESVTDGSSNQTENSDGGDGDGDGGVKAKQEAAEKSAEDATAAKEAAEEANAKQDAAEKAADDATAAKEAAEEAKAKQDAAEKAADDAAAKAREARLHAKDLQEIAYQAADYFAVVFFPRYITEAADLAAADKEAEEESKTKQQEAEKAATDAATAAAIAEKTQKNLNRLKEDSEAAVAKADEARLHAKDLQEIADQALTAANDVAKKAEAEAKTKQDAANQAADDAVAKADEARLRAKDLQEIADQAVVARTASADQALQEAKTKQEAAEKSAETATAAAKEAEEESKTKQDAAAQAAAEAEAAAADDDVDENEAKAKQDAADQAAADAANAADLAEAEAKTKQQEADQAATAVTLANVEAETARRNAKNLQEVADAAAAAAAADVAENEAKAKQQEADKAADDAAAAAAIAEKTQKHLNRFQEDSAAAADVAENEVKAKQDAAEKAATDADVAEAERQTKQQEANQAATAVALANVEAETARRNAKNLQEVADQAVVERTASAEQALQEAKDTKGMWKGFFWVTLAIALLAVITAVWLGFRDPPERETDRPSIQSSIPRKEVEQLVEEHDQKLNLLLGFFQNSDRKINAVTRAEKELKNLDIKITAKVEELDGKSKDLKEAENLISDARGELKIANEKRRDFWDKTVQDQRNESVNHIARSLEELEYEFKDKFGENLTPSNVDHLKHGRYRSISLKDINDHIALTNSGLKFEGEGDSIKITLPFIPDPEKISKITQQFVYGVGDAFIQASRLQIQEPTGGEISAAYNNLISIAESSKKTNSSEGNLQSLIDAYMRVFDHLLEEDQVAQISNDQTNHVPEKIKGFIQVVEVLQTAYPAEFQPDNALLAKDVVEDISSRVFEKWNNVSESQQLIKDAKEVQTKLDGSDVKSASKKFGPHADNWVCNRTAGLINAETASASTEELPSDYFNYKLLGIAIAADLIAEYLRRGELLK